MNKNRLELLIYGYIRELHPKDVLIPNIQRICYHFAKCGVNLVREWIYGKDFTSNMFHGFYMLDVTTTKPLLHSNLFKFQQDTLSSRAICVIPYLSSTEIQPLFPSEIINPEHSFTAIMTQEVRWRMTVLRTIDGIPVISNDSKPRTVLADDTENDRSFSFLIYCASHGVIGIDDHSMYQLKLDDIDQNFKFQKMENAETPTVFEEMGRFLEMRYLERRDVIVAVNLQIGLIRKFYRFDFSTNQWATVRLNTTKINIQVPSRWTRWKFCYDRDDDVLYFVSEELHVLRCGMESGTLEMILNRKDFGYGMIRALWMGHSTSRVLCILGQRGFSADAVTFNQIDLDQVKAVKDPNKAWRPYAGECVAVRSALNRNPNF